MPFNNTHTHTPKKRAKNKDQNNKQKYKIYYMHRRAQHSKILRLKKRKLYFNFKHTQKRGDRGNKKKRQNKRVKENILRVVLFTVVGAYKFNTLKDKLIFYFVYVLSIEYAVLISFLFFRADFIRFRMDLTKTSSLKTQTNCI